MGGIPPHSDGEMGGFMLRLAVELIHNYFAAAEYMYRATRQLEGFEKVCGERKMSELQFPEQARPT